jgi:pimeloyl-ACP methyl ester carboxylesterase
LLTACSREDDIDGHWTTPGDTERHVERDFVRSPSNLRIRWPRGRGSSSLPPLAHLDPRGVVIHASDACKPPATCSPRSTDWLPRGRRRELAVRNLEGGARPIDGRSTTLERPSVPARRAGPTRRWRSWSRGTSSQQRCDAVSLWWHGQHDANTPIVSAQRLVSQIRGANLRVWTDAGHFESYRRHDEVLAELLSR